MSTSPSVSSTTAKAALFAAVGVAAGAALGHAVAPPSTAAAPPPTAVTPAAGDPRSGSGAVDAAAIAAKVDPGVVDITTTLGYADAQAAGTGMVLTSSGEVLTNNHVIDGATKISVTDVGNGRTYPATVVGYDRSHDVAVLQLAGASGLSTVTPASAAAQVGAAVVGIGNAGGAGGTPSYAGGTVTAVDQTITATSESDGTSEQLTGLLQTDADIVAGDSGGPLVDTSGQVVGMDTAASSGFRITGSQGYAIPIAQALQIARQIEAGQASDTVHVGATALLGVAVQQDAGAVVAQVVSGGPADRAGIIPGDRITAVDGHAIDTPESLSQVMLTERPGATVRIDYADQDGVARATHVTLATGPPQ